MQEQSKYKIVLDNLLDITQSDSSIFTRINEKYYMDLYSLVGSKNIETIFNNETFEVSALDDAIVEHIKRIQNISNSENLVVYMEKHQTDFDRLNIRFNSENIYENYEHNKEKILNQLELKVQKSILKWKILNDKVTNILDETNIWPLHIGFLFLSLKREDKVIYAPLFLKEANITFVNGKPIIKSDGDIKVNEKLLFFLNNNEFNLTIDTDFKDYKISSLIEKLRKDWDGLYQLPESITRPFTKLTYDDVQNENIRFHPGAVLGIYQPWGGYSRNRMKDIILNNEMDDIIKVEFNKNVYKEVINKLIFNPNLTLLRITNSNLSQDKAIVSALNQNTVIWGPPGTGKSQTIVNLLANILFYGKTAIVASQKKAALEVIKNRMKSLAPFCLFILNTKDTNRKSFYKPIKEYLDMLENFNDSRRIESIGTISRKELEFISQASEYLNDSLAQNVLKAYYYIAEHKNNFDFISDMEFILSLPRDIKYPKEPTHCQTAKELLKVSKLTFFPFVKKYYLLRKIGNEIDAKMPNFDGSWVDLMQFITSIGFNNIDSEYSPFRKLNELIKMNSEISHKPLISNEEALRLIITEKIFNRINNFNEEQKRQYREFAQSVRINNLEPYRFVKKYADMIKQIYPIIIATPNTDLSGWSKEEFDYAILDESSQIFIENALPILYLAKVNILAGDTEQMKPSNWFGVRYTDDSIFGQVESVLDYALSLGVHSIMLNKNYRSNHAALMTFSSRNFYEGKLDVLDAASVWNNDLIEVYQVEGDWDNNRNLVEAKLAIQKVQENLNKYNKIILLAFNAKQSDYLTNEIYKNYHDLEEAIYEKRLLIRNIENIQGDEADLVVATVAYDKHTKLNSTYVCRPGGKNALNVAISRAKDKMIVIKTIKSQDIVTQFEMSDDMKIFKKWLEFLERTPDDRLKMLKKSFDSIHASISNTINKDLWFKDIVFTKIAKCIEGNPRFEIFKDYTVGSIDIDIVVTYNKIPFKCICFDTFNYSNSIEKYVSLYDAIKFLRAKKYDVTVINPLSWIYEQNNVASWFDTKEINSFEKTSVSNKTNTYAINKIQDDDYISTKESVIGLNVDESQLSTSTYKLNQVDDAIIQNDVLDEYDKEIEQLEHDRELNDLRTQAELNQTKQVEINNSEETVYSADDQNDFDFYEVKTEEESDSNNNELQNNDLDESDYPSSLNDVYFDNQEDESISQVSNVNENDIDQSSTEYDISADKENAEEIADSLDETVNNEDEILIDDTNDEFETDFSELGIDLSKLEQKISMYSNHEISNEPMVSDSDIDDGQISLAVENNADQLTREVTQFIKEAEKVEQELPSVTNGLDIEAKSSEPSTEKEEIDFGDEEDEADDDFVINFNFDDFEDDSNKTQVISHENIEQITLDKIKNVENNVNKRITKTTDKPSMQDITAEWIIQPEDEE
ncbi:AAA domain-containing protein [Mycoplasmopsis verecunda]|uniref:Superfamily I DNA and/or RNA helicase n=1 Tax=Mycoplasmopsis verecunda TaxID=171291 RepID=A0A1T4LF14_9BACT|nr:AAA domain-containing protein [Mycoplasmopsis verecunda]SJZ53382.1 Superfamily I DNA and/or RNA helicase [Mycoplasmopsis verecunda]